MKDYYAILEIPVTAAIPEIKQAYRKLVMIYHPDKNNDDPYSLAKFNEIKEAYEILINPGKKELYLQERWLAKARGRKVGEEMITPSNILIQSLELNKAVAEMDVHRMGSKAAISKIIRLFSEEVLDKLTAFGEVDINQSITEIILDTVKYFSLKEIHPVLEKMYLLAGTNEAAKKQIEQFISEKEKHERWEQLKVPIVLFITLLLCFIIYISANK